MPKSTSEFDYYVAESLGDNRLLYVTDVDYGTRHFKCKAGTKALRLGKKKAEDLLFLLTCNCVPAVMVAKVAGGSCPRNPKEQE